MSCAADAEFRRQVLVQLNIRNRMLGHCGNHVRRFDSAAFDFALIQRVYAIDEATVPFVGGVEVRPEAAIDEGIDDVAEPDEQLEMKTADEQRQDILRPYTFKPAD